MKGRWPLLLTVAASLVLVPAVIALYGIAFSRFPAADSPPVKRNTPESAAFHDTSYTPFWFFLLTLIVTIYVLKLLCLRFFRDSLRDYWSFIIFAAALPPIWFANPDWNNPHVFPIACWINDPVGILAIPAATHLWDLLRSRPLSIRRYTIRSGIEVLVFPFWFVAWYLFSFGFLHGGWI